MKEGRIKRVSERNARQINLSFSPSRSSLSSSQPHSCASPPSYLQPSTFFSYIDTIPQLPRRYRAHTCVIRTRVPGKENVFRGSSHQLAIVITFRIDRTPLFQGLLPAFPEIFQCLIRRARLSNFGPPSRGPSRIVDISEGKPWNSLRVGETAE